MLRGAKNVCHKVVAFTRQGLHQVENALRREVSRGLLSRNAPEMRTLAQPAAARARAPLPWTSIVPRFQRARLVS